MQPAQIIIKNLDGEMTLLEIKDGKAVSKDESSKGARTDAAAALASEKSSRSPNEKHIKILKEWIDLYDHPILEKSLEPTEEEVEQTLSSIETQESQENTQQGE